VIEKVTTLPVQAYWLAGFVVMDGPGVGVTEALVAVAV
jgi:hypothetical protein